MPAATALAPGLVGNHKLHAPPADLTRYNATLIDVPPLASHQT